MYHFFYFAQVADDDTSIQFYAMDSESLRLGKYDPEAQLLDMEETLANTQAQWKIVFGHHPPLSVGRRWGDDTILDQVNYYFSIRIHGYVSVHLCSQPL